MPIDFDKHFYIGCIPLYAMPTHPTDQTPCVVLGCPECEKPMWVSEKKRLLYLKDPEAFKIVCFTCLAQHAYKNGIDVELKLL